MASRIVGWTLLLLSCVSAAHADTVWLNDKGVENLEQIRAWLGPVRVFERLDPRTNVTTYYLRGRIVPDAANDVDVTDGAQGEEVMFEAWSRPAGAKPSDPISDFSAPFILPLAYVARIDHEVDGIFDFRLMFSDRDRQVSTPVAPGEAWKRFLPPLGPLLENPPEGTIDINLDGRSPPPEPDSVQSRVRLQGWILSQLTHPLTQNPNVVMKEWNGKTYPAIEGPVSILQPLGTDVGIERGTQELLLGLARERYYRGHRQDIADADLVECARQALRFLSRLATITAPDQFKRDGTPNTLTPIDMRRRLYRNVGLASRGAVIAILEAAGPGSLAPRDYNAEVRARLQREIAAFSEPVERANFEQQFSPLFACVQCPQCEQVYDPTDQRGAHVCAQVLAPEARLDVSPSQLAHEALVMMGESPEWWALHGNKAGSQEQTDGERLLQALLGLAALPASTEGVLFPDARRGDEPYYMAVHTDDAPLVLMRMLRPRTSTVAVSPELQTHLNQVAAPFFADRLSRMLTELDPARREAARFALQKAVRTKGDRLVSNQMVENLLAVASAQIAVEKPSEDSQAGNELVDPDAPAAGGTSTELNGTGWGNFNGGDVDRVDGLAMRRSEVTQYMRSRRKHAVRVLMILALLAKRSDSPEEEQLGRYVLSRLTDLRESIAEGRASQGEQSLIGVLNSLRRHPEPTLRDEARFLNTELKDELEERTRTVEQELEQLRSDLESALREHRERDARRLEGERERCRRRLERLARLRQK